MVSVGGQLLTVVLVMVVTCCLSLGRGTGVCHNCRTVVPLSRVVRGVCRCSTDAIVWKRGSEMNWTPL